MGKENLLCPCTSNINLHYCLEISLYLLICMFFLPVLPVFLSYYCSFSPSPSKWQQDVTAEPSHSRLSPSTPALALSTPRFSASAVRAEGGDGRAEAMGEEADASLRNMPDLKQKGQWEHSFPRTWIILLVINKRRN